MALSKLLPQVNAGVSEHVEQINLAMFGLKLPGVPAVIGPYSYSSVDANLNQTPFSFESIERFRAARTAEQAAQLTYNDVLDVVTLAVGNAYLHVIAASSRIEAQQAQVRNARTLYDQALDEGQAGTAPRIDLTRTEVQLHTEEYNLSVSRNNFDVAKLDLSRAIGLPLAQEFKLTNFHIPRSIRLLWMTAGVKAAEQNLESAKALLLQDEANAEKSDADLARYAQLVAKEDISRQQYDQALAAAKANRAAVVSATAAVQSYEQALHQAEGKLLQAKADLRSAQTAPQQ